MDEDEDEDEDEDDDDDDDHHHHHHAYEMLAISGYPLYLNKKPMWSFFVFLYFQILL